MQYISVTEASEKWNISSRRVRILCREGKIEGVVRQGRAYRIPADAVKPADGRTARYLEIPEQYRVLFARVDGLKAELDKRRPLTAGELARLRDEMLVEYVYNSNAIEGNTLTLRETALVLEGMTIDKKPLKDHLEAIGHREAFLFIEQLVTEKKPITESLIKQIHTLVLMDKPEDRGVYRRVPVRIMGAAVEPPQPYLVPVQMEALLAEYKNTKLHPIESAARFHLQFESIHPFIDGNGRTGRLLLNLMLMQHGYPLIDVKFADRKRYYDCFQDFHTNHDAGAMVRLIAEYLQERIRQWINTSA